MISIANLFTVDSLRPRFVFAYEATESTLCPWVGKWKWNQWWEIWGCHIVSYRFSLWKLHVPHKFMHGNTLPMIKNACHNAPFKTRSYAMIDNINVYRQYSTKRNVMHQSQFSLLEYLSGSKSPISIHEHLAYMKNAIKGTHKIKVHTQYTMYVYLNLNNSMCKSRVKLMRKPRAWLRLDLNIFYFHKKGNGIGRGKVLSFGFGLIMDEWRTANR